MSWTPLVPDLTRFVNMNRGVEFGYSIHTRCSKKERPKLVFTFAPALRDRWSALKPGTVLRLDADIGGGIARLLPVTTSNIAGSAIVKSNEKRSKRLRWQIPHTGPVADCFPTPKAITELKIIEISNEGLIFELPKEGQV